MKNLRFWIAIILNFYISIGFPKWGQGNTLETAGNVFQIAIPMYALLYSFTKHDKEGIKEFLKSYACTITATYTLKTLVHEKRPASESYNSFPSGHTASAFSGAAYLFKRYHQTNLEKLQGIIVFLAAGLVGCSRLTTNRHYLHDVVFGAFMGISITYFFTHPLNSSSFQLEIVPPLSLISIRITY